MAMTKKERERVEVLQEALSWARALSWRSYAPIVIPVSPTSSTPHPLGFLNNPHNGAIYYASSSSMAHCSSTDKGIVEAWANGKGHGGTQGPRALFATRGCALKDLRMKLQEKYGRHLAEIDAEIEKESGT